jgi:hypothetical protein
VSYRLVVDKSQRQRRIEGILIIVLPAIIASGLRLWLGPSPFISVVAFFVFFAIVPVGGAIAAFGLGERITIDERMRRILERAAKGSFWRSVVWMTVAYGMLMLSATLPMVPLVELPSFARWIVPLCMFGGASCSLICAIYIRLSKRRYDKSESSVEQYTSPWQWLVRFLPIQYLCNGASLTAVYFVAWRFDGIERLFVLLGGYMLGAVLEAVLAGLILRRKPILWHQFGFGMALLTSVLRMGVLMGAVFWLIGRLLCGLEGADVWILAGAGFAVGTLFMLAIWALSRLNDMRPRRAA